MTIKATLSIKGDEQEAMEALKLRNFDGRLHAVLDASCVIIVTFFADADMVRLQQWYNEPVEMVSGYGYPPGTLLYFRPGD